MKYLTNILTAAVLSTAAVFCFNSCIFEAHGDRFYRTLWESDEASQNSYPADNYFPAGELTLEFLCGSTISISTKSRAGASFGTYTCNEQTAVLHNLTMELDGKLITFIDAHRSGDTLFLRWHTDQSSDTFTTVMHRLSEYKPTT
jgi:hypothetical protein